MRGKRRAPASDVSCTVQSLCLLEQRRGQYFILVLLIHYLNLPLHHLHLHSTHSSSGTLAVISPSSQDFSAPCLLSVSHSLSCEQCDLWTGRKQCVCVIAQLWSRWRRGASITHPVTKISIDFLSSLVF